MINSLKLAFTIAIFSTIFAIKLSGATWAQSMMPPASLLQSQPLNEMRQADSNSNRMVHLAMYRGGNITGTLKYPPVTPVESYVLEPIVLIESIKCIRATFGSDEDQIYIALSNGERLPFDSRKIRQMKAGDIWKPHFFTSAVDNGSISLMESDSITDDDQIGIFHYDYTKGIGRHVEIMAGDGGVYEVIIEVRR